MWIIVTLVAAGFQTARTALQHRLRSLLSVSGAGFVRYLYGAPLSALAVCVAWAAGVEWPQIAARFWPTILGGGVAQILGTVCLIRAFDARDFAVGTVFAKTEVVQVALFSLVLLGEPLRWVAGWVLQCAWWASRTEFDTFRTGLKPSLLLATLGVVVSAGITGAAARWLLDLSWPLALLVGAIVGSTDAAAVFSLLKSSGVRLNERVAATLEIESGMNDPMAVYLTLAFIGVALAATGGGGVAGHGLDWLGVLRTLALQFGWGAALGLAAGLAMAELLKRLGRGEDGGGGIRALLLVSGGLSVFAATTWLGGSGFLAVYAMGLIAGNRARRQVRSTLSAMDGYAWLSQAGMFLLLGLLVTPSQLLPTLGPALGV